MGKRNPGNFDFSKLEKFLKTPKSIEEIQERFKIESYQTAKSIIQMATYCILIYETDGGKGHKKYGIMEKKQMMTAGNKTASLESLCAAVGTLLEDDKEKFIKYYNNATHSHNGKTIWFYMYEYNENQRIKQNERNRRKREEKRKMEQG